MQAVLPEMDILTLKLCNYHWERTRNKEQHPTVPCLCSLLYIMAASASQINTCQARKWILLVTPVLWKTYTSSVLHGRAQVYEKGVKLRCSACPRCYCQQLPCFVSYCNSLIGFQVYTIACYIQNIISISVCLLNQFYIIAIIILWHFTS